MSAAKRARLESPPSVPTMAAAIAPGVSDIDFLLFRETPFGNETGELACGEFVAGAETKARLLGQTKVLVIGAGGLGCEILKDLALSGFTDIHVIDADTVDVTNLNRQFLFRAKDVGRPKAEVAAAFIMARVPSVKVTHHVCYIQDMEEDFYRQFNVVIGGLDNLVARRWMNSLLCSFVEVDEETGDPKHPEQSIPFIDGGTEGFSGSVRVIVPRFTACFECSIDTFPPQQTFAMCTLAETPRKPEHCVAYAMLKLWPEAHPETKLDRDSPDHMRWLFERAEERARRFGIEGVTYTQTMGVVKNIIPAIASTNAIVSAACALEALKVVTFASQSMNNFFMYQGATGVYTSTMAYERKDECAACGTAVIPWEVSRSTTVGELIEQLKASPRMQLSNPSLRAASKTIFMTKPAALRAQTEPNLAMPLAKFVNDGDDVSVTDPVFTGNGAVLTIRFT